MVYARRPLRWLLATSWRYTTSIILALSAFWAFESQNDVQGIVYLLFATSYVFLLVATPVSRSRPNYSLAIVACSFAVFGLLAVFGKDNRRVAPVLNPLLPHVELEVKQSWSISQGNRATRGMTFRLFEVTLTSRWARGVEVDIYDFEFESNGSSYDNTFAPEFRGCDLRDLARNGTLICLVALELPQNATSGTLIFKNAKYQVWADVLF